MGLRGQSRIWYLRKFDAYCAERGLAVFDRDTVEGWVTGQIATARQHRGWLSYIRDFGRWLRARGHADAYVLSDKWKAVSAPARPYLLTNHEIEAFFTAATRLEIRSPWQWQAPAFFTLMHSCGIRTCEARNLLAGHVDLPGRHFDVLWSKTNRSRRLPITGDVTEILAACDKESMGAVRTHAGDVFHLVHRQAGHRRCGREGVQPDLGCGQPAAPRRR